LFPFADESGTIKESQSVHKKKCPFLEGDERMRKDTSKRSGSTNPKTPRALFHKKKASGSSIFGVPLPKKDPILPIFFQQAVAFLYVFIKS
jgi:hypothetical protein